MMKGFGASAVGMSTVPEAILARAAGLRVCGLSCITNYAAGLSEATLSHDEVKETVSKSLERIATLFKQFFSSN